MVSLIFVDKQIENFLLSSLELLCIDCTVGIKSSTDTVFCDIPSLEKITQDPSSDQMRLFAVSRDKNDRKKCPEGVIFLLYPIRIGILSSLIEENGDAFKINTVFPEYDSESFTVSLGGNSVCLTEREGKLFEFLWNHRGECVSRAEIREAVWENDADTNVIDVYVTYLRRKLTPLFGAGAIRSVRGKGYVLDI